MKSVFSIQLNYRTQLNAMGIRANVIGATGLVGKQLVKKLLKDDNFELVRIFVRRESGIEHPRLEQHIIDFDKTETWQKYLTGDVLFSGLGTTLKQAGGKAQQYHIDLTLNYNFAKAAKQNGIPKYILISSLSADQKAKLFYPRMKGELDDRVRNLGFKQLTILRPGLLTGYREKKRTGEVIALPIVGLITKFVGRKYRPIQDTTVAQAMINVVLNPPLGKTIFEGEEIFELAGEK